MDIIILRINGEVIKVAIDSVKSLSQSQQRSKRIERYKRFLEKTYSLKTKSGATD